MFVGPYQFNGSQAKELGSQNSQFQDQNLTSTHAPVNGWGGGYYPNGCPHCGYCPTCGRSNGYPRPFWEYRPYESPTCLGSTCTQ